MPVNNAAFDAMKEKLTLFDPVSFCEHKLTLEGKPFRLTKNGYKPFADIYRYIAIKALEKHAKPVVIVKGRQVGATTMASALEMYFMGCGLFGNGSHPAVRIIHAFPQLDLAFAYSKTKLNPMVSGSLLTDVGTKKSGPKTKSYMETLLDPTSPTNNSLQFKQFVGGNHMWIESTGDNADRLRGRSADIIFFDECQDIPAAAIGNASKILSKAAYGPEGDGVKVFFGTPKQRGSEFFEMWNRSSQQYYHLRCEECSEYFPLYTPGTDDWEKTWVRDKIVQCPKCNHMQDKVQAAENGKWVPLKNPDECDFVGFHMSQLFIPDFTKEKIIGEKPGNHPVNSERVYQNEVLGEFFSGESGIITPEQLREKCGDMRKFAAGIAPGQETMVIAGIDIGAKSDMEQLLDTDKQRAVGQSFSCIVVMSLSGPNQLSIQYATKFKRNDFASKKSLIDEVMRRYSVQLAVCDIGYSNDFTEIMQNEYGDRFLASQAVSKITDHVKYNQDIFPKGITFERDFYVGELYEQMKKGNIRFPYGDYEKLMWLVQHCTSMEIKPTLSRSGDVTPHYVKGSTPNDGFMALLNGYLAYKFLLTRGFTVKNPLLFNNPFGGKSPRQQVPVISGFVPRMK